MGIVDLGFSILKDILLVPKIQLALKDECLQFLGVRANEWIRLLGIWDWMR